MPAEQIVLAVGHHFELDLKIDRAEIRGAG